mmetsp:Transcript_21922/g.66597  ORF Transcript_21922/g.66597 Transcript_21922/m.66597 type:complete len:114 (+) Transcript_21922:23-364(+)|eukprot:scaffold242830_cov33-Tisochrysis_lutea.AAC.1
MSAHESTLDYILATDGEGYHYTVYSSIKEIGTASVTIEPAPSSPSVFLLHLSGMSDEADPHLLEGAPDPLHRSKGERVEVGTIVLPKNAVKDAAKVRIDAHTKAGLVIHLPRE